MKKTTVVAQPLLDGILMTGPRRSAMAIRKSDMSVTVEESPQGSRMIFFSRIPFLRGCIRLFQQIIAGTTWLLRSLEVSEPVFEPSPSPEIILPEAVDSKLSSSTLSQQEKLDLEKEVLRARIAAGARPAVDASHDSLDPFLKKKTDLSSWFAVGLGVFFSVVVFILFPRFLVDFIASFISQELLGTLHVSLLLNIAEGLIRICVFLLYLAMTVNVREIATVWMYHGAGHKALACYEAGEALTIENMKKKSFYHPRSAVAFLFAVILFSILTFSAVGTFLAPFTLLIDFFIRIFLILAITSLFYEIVHFAARYHQFFLCRFLLLPGRFIQRFTVKEPDEAMLEIALAALEAVLPEEEGEDDW